MSEVSPDLRPESGFLLRLRTWRDALPWLALVDCLRPATSVVHLTLVGLTCWASIGVLALLSWAIESPSPGFAPGWYVGGDGNAATGPLWQAVLLLVGPTLALWHAASLERVLVLLVAQWSIFAIWAIPAAYLMRQCALSMGGRLAMGVGEGLRLAARRYLALLLVPLIPTLAVALIVFYFTISGWLARIPEAGQGIAAVWQLLGLPLAILAGLLAFGGLFAIPLAWAGVAIEQEGSGFDGLSRGYEYVLRRPLQLVFYGIIATAIAAALSLLASGVTAATWAVVGAGFQLGSGDEPFPDVTRLVIASLPGIVALTLFWSLTAGLYLLLRRSANHQEIEDVWEVPRPEPEPLPELNV